MEVCGTHTFVINNSGLKKKYSNQIEFLSGPGCPVCVTDDKFIDSLIDICLDNKRLFVFSDLLKVKGSNSMSLLNLKEEGYDIVDFVSPFDILNNLSNDKENVVVGIGFETTVPALALLFEEVYKKKYENIKFIFSLKLTIPAIRFILNSKNNIDAFIAPGHVAAIIGEEPFKNLKEEYSKPFIIAGFNKENVLKTIEYIKKNSNKSAYFQNNYKTIVNKKGNKKALKITLKYFETCDETWRGIGKIKNSGLRLKNKYQKFLITPKKDSKKLNSLIDTKSLKEFRSLKEKCLCSSIILGLKKPKDCPLYLKVCNLDNPIGPCMVSGEGTCRNEV